MVEGKLTSGFEGVDVGDRIRVKLTSVDVQQGFIVFKPESRSNHLGLTQNTVSEAVVLPNFSSATAGITLK